MTLALVVVRSHDRIGAPGTIDVLCSYIAAGGTLAAWCRGDDGSQPAGEVAFELVAAWIEADKDRRSRYRAALDVREQHHKDRIIEQLVGMVTADLTAAFAPDGNLLAIDQMPRGVRHWIAGIEVEELFTGKGENRYQYGVLKKIKFFDKVRSTELLMKNLKMLVERHEVKGLSLADLLAGEKKDAT